ncbi:YadA-like family protein, partial [Psychrobacter sp. Ps6]|uniref:YadA-like family protein n=1 Tax=Psychrobacter sp. Ps6 TaxID=2790960 RepID=UPI001EDF238C
NVTFTSVTTGDTLLNTGGVSFLGGSTVRLSSMGLDNGGNQITNVGDGAADTDAVNIRQLNGVIETANKGWDISAQGNSTTASNVGPGEAVDFNSKNSNIRVSKTANSNDVSFELNNNLDLGDNGSVEMGSSSPFGLGSTTTLDRSGLTTGNSYFSTTVDGLGVRTGNGLINTTVSSVGVAVSSPLSTTLLSGNGLNIIGGPSVTKSGGINAGNKKVINVDDGVQAKDAVNVSQLNSASAAAKTEVAAGTNVAGVVKSTGQNGQDVYTVNADGVTTSAGSSAVTVTAGAKDATNITDYAVDLSADSKASLVKADSAMQSVVTQIDGEDVKTLTKDNNTANFLSGKNIVLSSEDGGIKVSTAENVTFTSVTTGDTLLNTGGVSFLGGSTVRLSSMGLDNGGNRITEVADGEDDTDAVNVRQLNATNSTVDLGLDFTGDDTAVVVNRKLGQTLTIQGGATELTENNIGVVADEEGNLNVRLAEDVMLGRDGSVRMESTVLNNAGVTITNGPNQTITLSNEGLDNGNNRIIKVGEGIAPTDAVNFAQLTTTNNEIAKGIKIGDGNSDNDQQFALGDTINITGDSNLTTTASATGVQVTLNNQLDLGDEGRMQIGNSIMNSTGFTFVDNGMGRTVRLSSTGLDNGGNPIRNVGRGELNSDAVNVGQLREVTIALDRGWDITAQGDVATQVRQGDAIDLNSRDGNIKVSRTLVNNGAALDANTRLAAVPAGANDISFDLNPDISIVSVTAGDTTINDNGLTIAGGPSITKSGIDAADNKVTNVQNGEVTAESQDAINGSQLYAQGTGISSIIGGNTVYNPDDGSFTNSNIGGTGQSNIDGAIASIRQGTIEINENVQVNTTNITNNTTDIAANTTNIATNTSNIMTNTTNITTNTTNIKTNTDKLDAGLNFGADSGATINKPVGDESVLSFTGGNNITTTAEGSSIKFDLNGNISVDSVTAGNTVINSSGITMQDGPSMTSQGLYAGNQRLTGVADGIEPKDAVNYSQLSALDSRLNNNMNDLGYRIDEVEDDANAGISAAMAMSALPQAFISGKSLIGGGVSTYNGESAVAIGFSKLSNDGRWVIKVNGTADTQGNVGGAIGAGFHFD